MHDESTSSWLASVVAATSVSCTRSQCTCATILFSLLVAKLVGGAEGLVA